MRKPRQTPISVARALILRHGGRAAPLARARAAEGEAAGDLQGASRWRSVGAAVEQLRADGLRRPAAPPSGGADA